MSTTLLSDTFTGRSADAPLASTTPDTTGHVYDAGIDSRITVDSTHVVRWSAGNIGFNLPSLAAAVGGSLSANHIAIVNITIDSNPGSSGILINVADATHYADLYFDMGDSKLYYLSDVTSVQSVLATAIGGNLSAGTHEMKIDPNNGSGTTSFYWDGHHVGDVTFTSAANNTILVYQLAPSHVEFGVVSASWVDAASAGLSAPTDLTFGTITTTAIAFSFTDPNTPQATAYQFQYSASSDMSSPSSAIPVDQDGTIDPVGLGLAEDTDYWGQVRTYTPSASAWSTAVQFHTAAIPLPTVSPVSGGSTAPYLLLGLIG